MKDQHGNKITEQEFTKDIGHRVEAPMTVEELFDYYARLYKSRMEGTMGIKQHQIIQEITKQIQSDLLKEVEGSLSGNNQINWHNNPIIHDLVFSTINNLRIKKLAEDKQLTI